MSEEMDLLSEMPELFDDFKTEADDRIEAMYTCLRKIEKKPNSQDTLKELLREVHSLKAGANVIGLKNTGKLLHKLEDFLGLIRDGKIPIDDLVKNLIYESVDETNQTIQNLSRDNIKEKDSFVLVDKLDLFISIATGEEMEAEQYAKQHIEGDLSDSTKNQTKSTPLVEIPAKKIEPEVVLSERITIEVFDPNKFMDQGLLKILSKISLHSLKI